MNIIDLTLPLSHRMPVFPGDPEVDITEIHTLDREGWRLRQLSFTTHIGTHLNVPSHMVVNGKTLSEYSLDSYIARSLLYRNGVEWDKTTGLVFSAHNISAEDVEKLIQNPPKFIVLSHQFDFDIDFEKKLLQHGIISIENVVNTNQLPQTFTFYGIPLNIANADGSPIRAFAML